MSDPTTLSLNQTALSYGQLRERFPELSETSAILKAFDFARERMPPVLFNHVTRSWIFAAKIGARRGESFDADIVAVTTLLHDLGFTPHGEGPHRFEVNGANVARPSSGTSASTIAARSSSGTGSHCT
jgi:HD superfamily phosphodiesterase